MAWTNPRTWVAGEKPSAATLNTHIRDNLKAIGDAWTAYTPTLTNWTLGNGTIVGAYSQAGKTVHWRVKYTAGSTSTYVGNATFSLPATVTGSPFAFPVGRATLADISAGTRATRTALSTDGTTFLLRDEAGVTVNATIPWTWATGDIIEVCGTYEAT